MRAVIFDLDGTLADTSGDLIAAANHCFVQMGEGAVLDAARDAAVALGGGRAMLTAGLLRLGRPVDPDILDQWYPVLLQAYGADICSHTVLYDGAMRAVETLQKAGYKTAICTNKPFALAHQLLGELGIRDTFHALIGADSLPTRKPDPAPLRAAVEQSGAVLERACLVGDTATDHNTARAANVPSILVSFGAGRADVHAMRPDAIIDHFDELPAVVDRLVPA